MIRSQARYEPRRAQLVLKLAVAVTAASFEFVCLHSTLANGGTQPSAAAEANTGSIADARVGIRVLADRTVAERCMGKRVDRSWSGSVSVDGPMGRDTSGRPVLWYGVPMSGYFSYASNEPGFFTDTSGWDWSSQAAGIQLAIRLSKQQYTLGEPVYLMIAVRNGATNTCNAVRSFPEYVYDVSVKAANGDVVPPTKYGQRILAHRGTSARLLNVIMNAGDAYGDVLPLDEMFDLSLSGAYKVVVQSLIPLEMETKSSARLTSNSIEFELVASDPAEFSSVPERTTPEGD